MPKAYASIDVREWADATYEELVERFEWDVPERYNVATEICTAHRGDGTALLFDRSDGETVERTFAQLDEQSSRLASWLADRGVGFGDRIGIALSQAPETPVAHFAAYKLGAVAVPISVLMGQESIDYRLEKADVSCIVATDEMATRIEGVETLVAVGDAPGAPSFDDALSAGDPAFDPATTRADDPSLITFTSGTSGEPKGVVYGHRSLASALPAFELMCEFPGDDAVFFTPADWAWVAGTLDTAFPAWWGGRTVVGYESEGFDPERVFSVMEAYGVTHAFLTPTMLRMLRKSYERPNDAFDLSLEVAYTGGEPTGDTLFEWVDEGFSDVSLNEHYGQSEADLLTTNSGCVIGTKPGSIGRPVPGHDVEILDENGDPLPPGEIGTIALRTPDPAVMLEYWNAPERTANAFRGDWLDTGDTGYRDEDGFFWFAGRGDDLIISSGYRISPTEVEQALAAHEGVDEMVVVGEPDDVRGEIVSAIVVPTDDSPDPEKLREELREAVRNQLSKYKYPRNIRFVESLPRTTTGKIDRREVQTEFAEDS
ncbi:acyl-CoA synthetase [Salinirarus marinus]|uniref:acyl-CoA synthetase n=1 Tax=Salinirarus marinus TaxID=3068310 RepID=UPI003C6C4A64